MSKLPKKDRHRKLLRGHRISVHMIIERDEDGWYVGSISELPGCHTQGRTVRELKSEMKEAIQAYLEAEEELPEANEFVGVERITV